MHAGTAHWNRPFNIAAATYDTYWDLGPIILRVHAWLELQYLDQTRGGGRTPAPTPKPTPRRTCVADHQ